MLLYYLRNSVAIRVGFAFTSNALLAGQHNIETRGLIDDSRMTLVGEKVATGEDFAVLVYGALKLHAR